MILRLASARMSTAGKVLVSTTINEIIEERVEVQPQLKSSIAELSNELEVSLTELSMTAELVSIDEEVMFNLRLTLEGKEKEIVGLVARIDVLHEALNQQSSEQQVAIAQLREELKRKCAELSEKEAAHEGLQAGHRSLGARHEELSQQSSEQQAAIAELTEVLERLYQMFPRKID